MNKVPSQRTSRPREEAHSNSALFAALRGQSAGAFVELAPPGANPSLLAREFAAAGWSSAQLAPVEHTETDIDALLTGLGTVQPHWMAVRGNAAVRALETWTGTYRPAVVLVETDPRDISAVPAPAWRTALARNGYLFALSDDGYHHFVRTDQAALLSKIAEHANLAWHMRLQTNSSALAQVQRDADQVRNALSIAQANGRAANARAAMLQRQIEAMHASTSWRSTKPLRWASRLRRDPGPALRQLRAVARAQLVALLRKLVRRVAANMEAHPGLRRRVVSLVAHHPALKRRLQALVRPGATLSNAMSLALPPAIAPSNIVGPQFKTLLLDELGRDFPSKS